MLGPFAMSPEESAARPTTRQSDLFPQWMKDGENHQNHQERLARQRFNITDDILYSCITYGDGVETKVTEGFTLSKGLGYALLVFFARKALGLYRLPFCEDRILSNEITAASNKGKKELRHIIPQLPPLRIEAICEEVQQLYKHTQSQLAQAGVKSITLTRRVYDMESNYPDKAPRYAQLLYLLKQAAELQGQSTVAFEMDTLNSFGDDGGYRHFPVTLRVDVPAKDVFYCSNLIASRDGRHAIEEGEWVVLNRAVDGVFSLPVDWIEIDNRLCEKTMEITKEQAISIIERYNPLVFRSCGKQHLDHAQNYSGQNWKPTIPARFIGAWRGFIKGL